MNWGEVAMWMVVVGGLTAMAGVVLAIAVMVNVR